jgi:NAD(P)-dependent dehydrogenase (short-subunit alcohol dehydrogenase family)
MLAGRARDFDGGDEDGYLATLPQGESARFIRPDEIAAAVAILASPESATITGVCLPIDRGVASGY